MTFTLHNWKPDEPCMEEDYIRNTFENNQVGRVKQITVDQNKESGNLIARVTVDEWYQTPTARQVLKSLIYENFFDVRVDDDEGHRRYKNVFWLFTLDDDDKTQFRRLNGPPGLVKRV